MSLSPPGCRLLKDACAARGWRGPLHQALKALKNTKALVQLQTSCAPGERNLLCLRRGLGKSRAAGCQISLGGNLLVILLPIPGRSCTCHIPSWLPRWGQVVERCWCEIRVDHLTPLIQQKIWLRCPNISKPSPGGICARFQSTDRSEDGCKLGLDHR